MFVSHLTLLYPVTPVAPESAEALEPSNSGGDAPELGDALDVCGAAAR